MYTTGQNQQPFRGMLMGCKTHPPCTVFGHLKIWDTSSLSVMYETHRQVLVESQCQRAAIVSLPGSDFLMHIFFWWNTQAILMPQSKGHL